VSLSVGNLVATIELQSSQFDSGVTNARGSLTELDRSLSAAQAASGAIGFDPKTASGAQAAAGHVDALSAAAGRAQTAAHSVQLPGDIGAARVSGQLEQVGTSAQRADSQVSSVGDGLRTNLGTGAGIGAGAGFVSGFADKVGDLASKTGPIGGTILGIAALGLTAGALLVNAIREGMQTEVDQDLFSAQTGLDAATTAKFGRAAGEAYSNAFGESVGANLTTARQAMAAGLLNPAANERDVQAVIEQLTGVSTILGEDIPAVARAAGQAIKTGIATDASSAFDLLVMGSRAGLNVSEDWLDTINEYSTQFRKLGLDGPHAVGLLSQAVKGGARDTDVAADALKEFSIRAVDGSATSKAGYEALGLSAEQMTRQMAQGGAPAAAGLQTVLDRLRNMQDPAQRAAAAVALFGTQAEDMGGALTAMNFGTAAEGLDRYAGAAANAVAVMGDNASSSITGATNSLNVAKQGVEAALAQAVGPYLKNFADSIANNRVGVIDFFQSVGDGAFNATIALAHMVSGTARLSADLIETLGTMTHGALSTLGGLTRGLGELLAAVPGLQDVGAKLQAAGANMSQMGDNAERGSREASGTLRGFADRMDQNVIPAMERTRTSFDGMIVAPRNTAAFNDALTKVDNQISQLGVEADGSRVRLDAHTGALDLNNAAQARVGQGLAGMAGGLKEEIRTGAAAGATVEELTRKYQGQRQALIDQLVQMGLTREQADRLATSYGLLPNLVNTTIAQPGMPAAKSDLDVLFGKVVAVPNRKEVIIDLPTAEQEQRLKDLGFHVEHLPNGLARVTADTPTAQAQLDQFIAANANRPLPVRVTANFDPNTFDILNAQLRVALNASGSRDSAGHRLYGAQANGGILESYASGGSREDHVAQVAPAGAMRLWAEPETDGEAYIPLAASKRGRSLEVLDSVAARFGKRLVDAGGQSSRSNVQINQTFNEKQDPRLMSAELAWRMS
jgi:trimeric autotransporter adhesin